jgi:hypothetical protein
MHVFTLRRTQTFPHRAREVFSFFETPENLSVITPRWLDFRILTPSPIHMEQGTLIDYTIRWLTVPVRWTTLITNYNPPHTFVDEQIRGPYALWHHRHSFVEKDGWTEMTDEVRYALPFGPLGRIAHTLLVRHQLEEIFDHRSRVIGRVFGVPPEDGGSAPAAQAERKERV